MPDKDCCYFKASILYTDD